MRATKIRMKSNCNQSNTLLEIDKIYIEGCDNPGFFDKSVIYDYLMKNPTSIYVDLPPYPNCVPAQSIYGEKYVKSSPDNTIYDNLLNLPRV
jgi:hypothetical protein